MTLSRNTPEVIKCKVRLVKAFSEAKRRLNKKDFNYGSQRLDLRNGLKDISRLAMTDQIKHYLEIIGGDPKRNLYAQVHDAINVALTSETSKQMRVRAEKEGLDIKDRDLIRDFFPVLALQIYIAFCDNITAFMRLEQLDPLLAINKAAKMLPVHHKIAPIAFEDHIKILQIEQKKLKSKDKKDPDQLKLF